MLIAVIGRRWISSHEGGKRRLDNPDDFVRIGIATALKRNIRVIPVLVDGATMPPARELPNDLKLLVPRNALELSHKRFSADLERLIGALERALEKTTAERGVIEHPTVAHRESEEKPQLVHRDLKPANLMVDGSQRPSTFNRLWSLSLRLKF